MAEDGVKKPIEEDKIRHFIHEIRTPLNAISTLSRLLLQSETSTFSSEDRQLIQTIIQASDMSIMIIEPQNTIVNLYDLVSEVLNIVTVEAKKSGVSILVKRTDLDNMKIKRVPSQLKHSISNLLRNGIKFSRGKVYMIYHGGIISVYDNGPGIPKEDRSKLFVFGERLGSKIEGNGIGLALCKQIMQKNGGDLIIRPNVPNTIFDIILP